MCTIPRIIPWLGCAAGCALSGCSTTPKSQLECCTTSVPVAVATEISPSYDHYTPPPPVMRPIPMPAPVEPLVEPSPEAPPPPQTQSIPNNKIDFFESASNRFSN